MLIFKKMRVCRENIEKSTAYQILINQKQFNNRIIITKKKFLKITNIEHIYCII